MDKGKVTAEQELTIIHLCGSIVRRLVDGVIPFDTTRDGLVALAEDRVEDSPIPKIGDKKHAPKRDLAEERRSAIETNLRKRNHIVSVPKPDASNRNFADWKEAGMGLFYRAPDSVVSYTAWMTSHGQAKHWTVADENERKKIVWEPCVIGYWFLAEISLVCPQVKTSWNDLTAPTSGIRLLSLEEYAIVYWTHRDLTGERIDINTWSWLRTRYGLGALRASDDGGGVSVSRGDASYLSAPDDNGGGRAVEVVL